MKKYTEGDAMAELEPLTHKLERLGEESRSTYDTLKVRSRELGHPHLIARVTDYKAALELERKAREEDREDFERQLRAAETSAKRSTLDRAKDHVSDAQAAATATWMGLPGMYPLALWAEKVRAGYPSCASAAPAFDMIPRLIVIPREQAVGTITALYIGCEPLMPQVPWKADMRCFIPEAWSEEGRDLRRMYEVLALPKIATGYGHKVATVNAAICLTMQFELSENRDLWSCLVMCERLETAR